MLLDKVVVAWSYLNSDDVYPDAWKDLESSESWVKNNMVHCLDNIGTRQDGIEQMHFVRLRPQ